MRNPFPWMGSTDSLRFRVATGFSGIVGSNLMGLLVSSLVTPLLARHLGVAGYGEYQLAIAHTLLFLPFANWAIEVTCLRQLTQQPGGPESPLGTGLALRSVLSAASFVASIAIAWRMNYAPYVKLAIVLYSLNLLTPVLNLPALLFQAKMRFGQVTTLSLLSNLVLLILVLWGLQHDWGIVALLAANTFVQGLRGLITFLLAARTVRLRPRWELQPLWTLFVQSSSVALASLLTTIRVRFDVLLLSQFHHMEASGLYAAPFNMLYATTFLSQGLVSVFFPLMAHAYPAREDHLRQWFRFLLLLIWAAALPISLGGVLLADRLLVLIFGHPIPEAVLTFQVLSLSQFFVLPAPLLGTLLIIVGSERQGLRVSFIVTIGSVLLNLLLIPRLSHLGAALTCLGGAVATFAIAYRMLRRHIRLTLPLTELWPLVLPCLGMVLVLIGMESAHVLTQVALGASAYLLTLALCTNLFRTFRSLVPRQPDPTNP